jgi:hypothetical protein
MAACGDCFFYASATTSVGLCKRYPPDRQRVNSRWPGVEATEWCGDYRPGSAVPPEMGGAAVTGVITVLEEPSTL